MGLTDGGMSATWFMDESGAFYLSGQGLNGFKWNKHTSEGGWKETYVGFSKQHGLNNNQFTGTFTPFSNIAYADDGTAFALGQTADPDSVFALYHRVDSQWLLSATLDLPKSRFQNPFLALSRQGPAWVAFGDKARGGRLSVIQITP